MGQDEERQESGRGRGHKKPETNENKKEKTTPKGQPARVVLKSSSSAIKTTPRITLRTTPKTTPKASASLRETPSSKKETSSATRHTYSSLRSTPASHTKDPSPVTRPKAIIRESPLRPTRDSQIGFRQQGSAKKPPSARPTYERVSKRKDFNVSRNVSISSEADSNMEFAPNPKSASIDADIFTAPNGSALSSSDELEIITQVGDSPFYADGELSGDDLESRMRSFLRRRERSCVSRRSEIKSVKWDPAIVACSPLSPVSNKLKHNENHIARLPQERQMQEPVQELESSLDNLNRIAMDLKKADRRILQQLLEALKNVDSSDDTTIMPRKARVPLGEQNFKVKDNQPTTPTMPNSQDVNNTIFKAKGLNPEAPVYRNFAPVKARFSPQKENKENIPQGAKWPLNVQRKRPHSSEDSNGTRNSLDDPAKPNKYIPPALRMRKASPSLPKQDVEPIWIKTFQPFSAIPSQAEDVQQNGFQNVIEFQESLLDSPLDSMHTLQSPLLAQPPRLPLDKQLTLPPSWMTGFQNAQPQQLGQPIFPMGVYAPYVGFGFQPNVVSNPTVSLDWYPVPMIPLPAIPAQHEQFPKHQQQPNKKAKIHTKKLPVNLIPSESEAGRTAMALEQAWATQVLDKFIAKYPMTGKAKPLPKLTKEKKVATKIQQRLEVLLLYQKEKKAMEEQFGQTPILELPRIASDLSFESSSADTLG
ncbi:hypothetical protein BKA65DRAFT_250226 [Rhexocercosporidium sp. MPI-PUGE-AT-0058]|nr:hypothetical protein BKA65DRAFT_250226 [Rhexocercosporidium sp. MPI-PUGE-AT-0058]